jgi:hypothetical protein
LTLVFVFNLNASFFLSDDIREEVVERFLAFLAATALAGEARVLRGQDVEAGGVNDVGYHVPEAFSGFDSCPDFHCSPLTFIIVSRPQLGWAGRLG